MFRSLAAIMVLAGLTGPAMAGTLGCYYSYSDQTIDTRMTAEPILPLGETVGAAHASIPEHVWRAIERAQAGDGEALYRVAWHLAAGDGVPQDYPLAMRLVRRAVPALTGESRAQGICFAAALTEFLRARAEAGPGILRIGPVPLPGRAYKQ